MRGSKPKYIFSIEVLYMNFVRCNESGSIKPNIYSVLGD